ncbi:transglutaminase-like domain-containing protein [Neobacillus sp. PS3-40]|uniref:transglutaminase-like domain-containing protein n=1 Tax=Neobacillus sp. PS3-40 TaxID=3070679 RepID=UPI0027E205D5|nr:transglutaminase-like domain-containing protein [Neobacillus sp. PS3-40]WML42737.1 transglutaminase-like domain-containing protein [Neobacillus sp. PS3-40]
MIKRDLSTFLLYMFGFILLWEWLRPIEQLTDTDHIEVFILFLLFCFLTSFFRIRWIFQSILKILFILFTLNLFYKNSSLHDWWRNLKDDIGFLFSRNWDNLSNEFRTILFFILLWMMVYLIQYWLLNRQRIFIFFFATVLYITVLDAFTPYNAKVAIVRTVICGFAVMGMLTFYRFFTKGDMKKEHSFTRKWMIPLSIIISLSVIIGFTAPKAAPIWPDPVPFFKSTSNKGGTSRQGSVSKVGYGEDDSHLGGPFIKDKSLVFKVVEKGKNYWKVETKDIYTGKGWMASGSTNIPFKGLELIPVFGIPENVDKTMKEATLFLKIDKNYLIYPAGIQRIIPSSFNGETFDINTNTEKIYTFDKDHNPLPLDSYQITYDVPKYKEADLVKSTDADRVKMSQEFINRYTRLPVKLPLRIKELAENITAGKNNWFDKAKAIESYFDSNDFSYEQKNVAVPGTNDDYVDQFLFETKRGYCDNFSSSMAVMLRTLGIPTRWVKGFNGGEFIGTSKGDMSKQLYQITNNNAHSWVEVYLPNQGWVPFEPTKGFTNDVEISYSVSNTPPSKSPTTTPNQIKKPQKPLQDDNQTTETKKSFDVKIMWSNIKLFWINKWKWVLVGLVIMGFVTALLYRKRGRWFPYYLLLYYRYKKNDENFGYAYLVLLKQLERYGLKRKEDQTLRNYALYIDSFFSTRKMTLLTARYEQFLYKDCAENGSWIEVRELWENLIKKTIA